MFLNWITDPHLNFVSDWSWLEPILYERPAALLITGDIAEARSLSGVLARFAEETTRPVYFVLGNHDFYKGSIAGSRKEASDACKRHSSLFYLHELPFVRLTDATVLMGVDGWYDGRAGNFWGSGVMLNDFLVISDFRPLSMAGPGAVLAKMKALADESANLLKERIAGAINPRVRRIIIATHVPPFPGAAWHEGRPSDSEHLPFFSNVSVGRTILEATETFREKLGGKVDIYCGHTHGEGVLHPAEGLTVYTGAAEYYAPRSAGVIDYE